MLLNKKYDYNFFCTLGLFFMSIICGLMVLVKYVLVGSGVYFYLIWNLFLSWIPYGISLIMDTICHSKRMTRKGLLLFILGAVWLLFYPNAPYMITDFIHLQQHGGFLIWYDLAVFTLFIWTSFLLGYMSIYLVFRMISTKFNPFWGGIFVFIVLYISSYAIYLGRFMRWNSWDILANPIALLISMLQNLNYQSVIFSILFGTILTLIYGFLYIMSHLGVKR